MAEAHQGVAFAFIVTEEDGLHLSVSLDTFKAVMLSGFRSWRRKTVFFFNQVLNGFYPSHPMRGIIIVSFVTGLKRYKNIDLTLGTAAIIQDKIPKTLMTSENAELTACALCSGTVWLSLVFVRQYSLKKLFSYHGWMYEIRGKISLRTKLWMLLLKLLIGNNPGLYSYQTLLPNLPVPKVQDTVTRYLRTVKPLLDEESYKRIEKSAIEFQKGVGRRLQHYLIFKSFVSSNYVSDWWEEYVYLRGRTPIMVNSNFYGTDLFNKPLTTIQAARAANCIVGVFSFRRASEKEIIKPIMAQDSIPLCSRQHERQFNTTRVPGEVHDQLIHEKDSKHVAVYCKGKWFKLYAYHKSQPLNAKELEIQIQKIIDNKVEPTNCEKYLGALTACDRVPWAKAREKYFKTGKNKYSLNAIEKAAFVVVLDEESYDFSVEHAPDLDSFARSLLHGKGYDRWFDKSFNLILTKNARVGINVEHSWADAPVSSFMWEYMIYDEIFKIGYDSEGHSNGTVRYNDLVDPIKLNWELNEQIEEVVMANYNIAFKLLNDVDLHIEMCANFGKDFIKKCNVSPDAFIQMALQLAYYRDIGRHHLTYEASMTRLFREGRTETVRSCSIESSEWVKSMVNEGYTNKQRVDLLKKACEYHVQQYRDSMTGKGVDRHLFCLYVVSKYLQIDIPFLKEVLSEPWRLSTSQIPHSQTGLLDVKKFVSAGGGFGPVADDGYGVCYNICGENMLCFHISSKKSSDITDSIRFGSNIKEALNSIKHLFDLEKAEKSSQN